MSYCRWSSNDFTCDVYVYEDAGGGWTTHVAGNRVVWDVPLPPEPSSNDAMEWIERSQLVSKLLRDDTNFHRLRLPDPVGGRHGYFNHDTPGECADNLEALRAQGFNVPQYAIDALRSEQGVMTFMASGVTE